MTREKLKKALSESFSTETLNGEIVIKGNLSELIDLLEKKIMGSPFTGAFTGMYDKNKKPIHEGDQVKLYYKGEYFICRVIYDPKHAAFLIKWPDGYVNQYLMDGNSYEVVDRA